MEGTRLRILTNLQRDGRATVEGLAHSLGLAPATIRRHMDILQRDHLIAYEEVKKATGRPEYSFFLTEAGHEVMPKDYPRLLGALFQEITSLGKEECQGRDGEEIMKLLLGRIAQRVVDGMSVSEQDSLEKRASALTALLEREQLMPVVEQANDGIRIMALNCPFRSVAMEHHSICALHSHLISKVLGAQVSIESCIAWGDSNCSHMAYPE